jgi:hypothetical protein
MRHAMMAVVALLLGVTLLFAEPPRAMKAHSPNDNAAKVLKIYVNG